MRTIGHKNLSFSSFPEILATRDFVIEERKEYSMAFRSHEPTIVFKFHYFFQKFRVILRFKNQFYGSSLFIIILLFQLYVSDPRTRAIAKCYQIGLVDIHLFDVDVIFICIGKIFGYCSLWFHIKVWDKWSQLVVFLSEGLYMYMHHKS